MRKDLERASIATDEQPELEPGTRVQFISGHNPTPNAILTGTIVKADYRSRIGSMYVAIRPDEVHRENGWPHEVYRKKSEVRVI